MRVKCFAAMSKPPLKPRPLEPASRALNEKNSHLTGTIQSTHFIKLFWNLWASLQHFLKVGFSSS